MNGRARLHDSDPARRAWWKAYFGVDVEWSKVGGDGGLERLFVSNDGPFLAVGRELDADATRVFDAPAPELETHTRELNGLAEVQLKLSTKASPA